MGLLWSSPAPPPASQSPSAPPSSSQLPEPQQTSSSTHPAPIAQLTRDEMAEREFHSFLQKLETDVYLSSTKNQDGPSPIPPHSSQSTSKESSKPENISMKQKDSRPSLTSPKDLSLEDSLLPTKMSCRNAFDMAFLCQSFGGQFNNVYRYGGLRSCSDHWSAFWFCMRTKGMPAGVKEEKIRNHYKHRALKYQFGPSSEDIWESRETKLEWGDAFNVPLQEELGTSDEEWNRRETVRREERRRELEQQNEQ